MTNSTSFKRLSALLVSLMLLALLAFPAQASAASTVKLSYEVPSNAQICSTYTKGGLKPLCKLGSKGSYLDVKVTKISGSNIVVNERWAQAITQMRAAALRSGYNLQAKESTIAPYSIGSYRSYAAQKWLYDHGYPAAAPGQSMHQWGLAIDFTCNGITIGQNYSCINWMKKNASAYGVWNLPSEPWHWSSNGK